MIEDGRADLNIVTNISSSLRLFKNVKCILLIVLVIIQDVTKSA